MDRSQNLWFSIAFFKTYVFGVLFAVGFELAQFFFCLIPLGSSLAPFVPPVVGTVRPPSANKIENFIPAT